MEANPPGDEEVGGDQTETNPQNLSRGDSLPSGNCNAEWYSSQWEVATNESSNRPFASGRSPPDDSLVATSRGGGSGVEAVATSRGDGSGVEANPPGDEEGRSPRQSPG